MIPALLIILFISFVLLAVVIFWTGWLGGD